MLSQNLLAFKRCWYSAAITVVHANALIIALEKAGFEFVRQRGRPVRMRHADGRVVTIRSIVVKILGAVCFAKYYVIQN